MNNFFRLNSFPKGRFINFASRSKNNCTTKVIINSLSSKIIAGGGTVGNLKCIATYLDTNFTTTSKSECTTMSLRAKIEAGGGIAGDLTCVENYLKLNFYGDYTMEQATMDTMPIAWEDIGYAWDEEWLYFN